MTRKESLTTRHLKRLSSSNNSDATMSSIPDEMIFCILENCRIFDILTSFQYVNKQFYEQCKIYIAQVQRRYVLFGSYRYDLQKHELKFIPHIIFPKLQSILSNMLTEHAQEQHLSTTNSFDPPTTAHPNTSQIHDHSHAKYFIPSHTMNLLVHFTTLSKHWRKGMNNFKYHSIHMPYDSLFAYPLLFSGNSKLSKGLFHHSPPLQDEFKIICVDLETFSCVRWSLDLEPYFPWEPIPLQVRQTFQNHKQLIIVEKSGYDRCHGIKEKHGTCRFYLQCDTR
ncbi:hypothetical protein C9374_001493 [Naegleria lovaniensis]|uniref:F-box domain-containing protein n=1 Tax=Naegleria lovaniensis TaxID=51637 RepID=A0AA88KN40_NAELO|nr:uncharacterized protein C9374_001493 [Naegleria lovaniensis]KAG2387161.1 hypothetical protein C9374_001493 [Naegleria lovaniensis]